MDRGLRAPLSPNEESTLRKLAVVGESLGGLRLPDLNRLRALKLAEDRSGAWTLTAIGRQRLASMGPKPDTAPPWDALKP